MAICQQKQIVFDDYIQKGIYYVNPHIKVTERHSGQLLQQRLGSRICSMLTRGPPTDGTGVWAGWGTMR